MSWLYWLIVRMVRIMNAKRSGDIRVIGLVAGTHVIEDLAWDVPHGQTVTIPGDMAIRSKDLWRAISSKCLFQLPSASPPPTPFPAQVSDSDRSYLESQVGSLRERVKTLEAENERLQAALQTSQDRENDKLDSILAAIKTSGVSAGPMFARHGSEAVKRDDGVDGSAPTFLPSEIKPTDVVDARIDVQGERSEESASTVSSSADRLRQIKRGTT